MRTPKAYRTGVLLGALACLCLSAGPGLSGEARARADYMIHCQGCHTPDGRGFPDKVPDLRASLPRLLAAEGGRAFLVQVPGSAQSALSDSRLAGTLNWMVWTFSDPAPAAFVPFTETETTRLRAVRLDDVPGTRARLIGHMEAQHGGAAE
ncbi:MAG: hypothetical protein RLO08_01725 [Parvibaculaceae bacterium]